jgi:hypothetical protein
MSKVRINDLARELEVKSRAILDVLREVGVTDPKTHSSSLEGDEAQRVRAHFQRGSGRNGGSASAKNDNGGAQRIDWSRVQKPGDVLRAIQQRKEEADRPPAPRPQAAPQQAAPQPSTTAVRPPSAPTPTANAAAPAAGQHCTSGVTRSCCAITAGAAGAAAYCAAAAPGPEHRHSATASTSHRGKTAGWARGGPSPGLCRAAIGTTASDFVGCAEQPGCGASGAPAGGTVADCSAHCAAGSACRCSAGRHCTCSDRFRTYGCTAAGCSARAGYSGSRGARSAGPCCAAGKACDYAADRSTACL